MTLVTLPTHCMHPQPITHTPHLVCKCKAAVRLGLVASTELVPPSQHCFVAHLLDVMVLGIHISQALLYCELHVQSVVVQAAKACPQSSLAHGQPSLLATGRMAEVTVVPGALRSITALLD